MLELFEKVLVDFECTKQTTVVSRGDSDSGCGCGCGCCFCGCWLWLTADLPSDFRREWLTVETFLLFHTQLKFKITIPVCGDIQNRVDHSWLQSVVYVVYVVYVSTYLSILYLVRKKWLCCRDSSLGCVLSLVSVDGNITYGIREPRCVYCVHL